MGDGRRCLRRGNALAKPLFSDSFLFGNEELFIRSFYLFDLTARDDMVIA